MSDKLARFIQRHPHMFAEYRAFAVTAIRKNDEAKRKTAQSAGR